MSTARWASRFPTARSTSGSPNWPIAWHLWLVAGMLEADGEERYNTAALINAEGELVGRYRKHKLEHELVRNTPGNQTPTFDTPYGRVGIMICADRRDRDLVKRLCESTSDPADLSVGRDVRAPVQRSHRASAIQGERRSHRLRASGGVPRDRT